jgi:hypothetical protein
LTDFIEGESEIVLPSRHGQDEAERAVSSLTNPVAAFTR